MKKILIMILGILSFGLVMPLTVNAACALTGQIVRVMDNATATTAYLKTSPLSILYYTVGTTDSDLRDALRNCQNSGQRCYVIGSAASCPTTTGSMGIAGTVIVNP
jgi:hypothetical protein